MYMCVFIEKQISMHKYTWVHGCSSGYISTHGYMEALYTDTFMQNISTFGGTDWIHICGYTLDTDLDTKVDINNFAQKKNVSHNW